MNRLALFDIFARPFQRDVGVYVLKLLSARPPFTLSAVRVLDYLELIDNVDDPSRGNIYSRSISQKFPELLEIDLRIFLYQCLSDGFHLSPLFYDLGQI